MAYPDYSTGPIKPPHKYLLVMAKQMMPFTVVPQSVDVNVLGPYDANGKSHRVRVRVVFIEVDDIPKDFRAIRG